MILFGLLLGRWWKTALVAGAVGWAALLLAMGIIDLAGVPGAMLLGLLNTGVGVALHQGGLRLVRRLRPSRAEAPTAAATP
jgi:hypothetical protein